jgi:hypothetical protein
MTQALYAHMNNKTIKKLNTHTHTHKEKYKGNPDEVTGGNEEQALDPEVKAILVA